MRIEEQLVISKEAFDLAKEIVEADSLKRYLQTEKKLDPKERARILRAIKFRRAACNRRLQEIEDELVVKNLFEPALKEDEDK